MDINKGHQMQLASSKERHPVFFTPSMKIFLPENQPDSKQASIYQFTENTRVRNVLNAITTVQSKKVYNMGNYRINDQISTDELQGII